MGRIDRVELWIAYAWKMKSSKGLRRAIAGIMRELMEQGPEVV